MRPMNWIACLCLFALCTANAFAVRLDGFEIQGSFGEQVRRIDTWPDAIVTVVAPPDAQCDPSRPTLVVFYALPNGNSTEQTIGRLLEPGLSWRFDIQHIGAQSRALRDAMADRNLFVVYTEAVSRSWPQWRSSHEGANETIHTLVHEVADSLPGTARNIALTSHSGGGSFLFGYIEGASEIPDSVERIAFLDSDYSYSTDLHGDKIVNWLRSDPEHTLAVLCYDDRDIEFEGKKIVSDSGGTWRATMRLIGRLRRDFTLERSESGPVVRFAAPGIDIRMHRNPGLKILHTALVGDMNGFIHAMTVYTPLENRIATFGPPRTYGKWIEGNAATPEARVIPSRAPDAMTGTAFIASIKDLPRQRREEAVHRELLAGNIPEFLRHSRTITVTGDGIDGSHHTISYEVMPDYLSIGSDEDFVRMPMNPYTAEAFCGAFDFVLPTRKMVDDIWKAADLKLEPQPLTEEREAATTFLQHNDIIENQRDGAPLGKLVAGIKKDVVATNRIRERPHRVAIYGWHYPDGKPIQPLTIVHVDWYVDYSHGIRPVRRMMTVDGSPLPYEDILANPHLAPLLSDEGEIGIPHYTGGTEN